MNAEQIMNAIRNLSMSQGFYGRLLESIDENPEILDKMVEQKFGDVVDMVMWLES